MFFLHVRIWDKMDKIIQNQKIFSIFKSWSVEIKK